MNCLRCGTPLSLAVCSACGFDHKTTPIMLLTQAEENSLHISRFFNIDIVSDESLSIDKRYKNRYTTYISVGPFRGCQGFDGGG